MRRTLLSIAAAGTLFTLAVGSRGTGDSSAGDSDILDDSDTGLGGRNAVLIHTGHAGVGPEGIDGSMTHQGSTALLEEAGLEVQHDDAWPESFDRFRLVILPGPGDHDSSVEFSPVERADLTRVCNAGGVIVVEAEPGVALNADVVNALVWDLGGSMHTTGEAIEGSATPWGEHPLTEGVDAVGLDLSTVLARGEETCLLVAGDDCVAVAATTGEGWVVLLADGNLLSDIGRWDEAGYDNARFLENLARLP
jgi:hypothetical protein